MHIVGTAGHVDHGKSSLVKALTGTNPDRWAEEQSRGMTLDLGFAHLHFDDGVEAGIVDVPGHERFLHNMLAGAAGMELLLLVVAADEGVMPQTVEHVEIVRYLNVQRTLVVVSKSDLLTAEELAFACETITESLRGTIAQDAPQLPVSSVTGAGLAELRTAIHDALASFAPRNPQAPAYLPVDRVFALAGHGTIVTGTLMQGSITVGDSLRLEPSGKTVRVRSLQSFGERRDRVEGGTRTAVNLPGVDVREIARGEMLVDSQFVPSDVFDVRFCALHGALAILRRRNAVRVYIGSAEILGTLVLETIPTDESEMPARIFLRRPTVAYPGSTFVARRVSPKNLLGGGRILHAPSAVDSPDGGHDARGTSILAALSVPPLCALTSAQIARESNLREDAVESVLAELVAHGEVVRIARPPAFVAASCADALLVRVLDALQEQHRAQPWALGATCLALSRALCVDEPLLLRILDAYAEDGRLARRAGYFSAPDHEPVLTPEQQAFFEEQLGAEPANQFVPVPLVTVAAAVKHSRIAGIGKAFDTLLAKGTLVKVGDELYRGAQIAQIRARTEQFLRANRQMTMAQFRDLVGTSRKYAVPLLEWFDARGITVRSGDYRMLRSKAEQAQ